jgi:hypothetical protein
MIINSVVGYKDESIQNSPILALTDVQVSSLRFRVTNSNGVAVNLQYNLNGGSTVTLQMGPGTNTDLDFISLTSSTTYTLNAQFSNINFPGFRTNNVSLSGTTLAAQLFTFSSHIFTNVGVTGGNGPTLAQCRTAYSSTSWAANNLFFNMNTQGIQRWTVPATGIYRIEVAGARGGNSASGTGANGVIIRGNFSLIQGEIINILVGQLGVNSASSGGVAGAGGGGGTFVVSDSNNPLIIAGGGGGSGQNNRGSDASYSTSGVSRSGSGGVNGNGASGGNGDGSGGGNNGGGFVSNGSTSGAGGFSGGGGGGDLSRLQGKAYLNGGQGGIAVNNTIGAFGGFGGGATGYVNGTTYSDGGGGGGGYSGGGSGSSGGGGAGGGGSINNGSNQSQVGTNSGNGYVSIVKL